MTPDLIFKPWIGSKYYKSGKLLLIGESHYTEGEEFLEPTDLTTKVMEKHISKLAEYKFFTNAGTYLEEILKKKNDPQIWHDVAFANAIQNGLLYSSSQPDAKDIKTVQPAFWQLLNNLKPNKVIVCSKRMWNGWLDDENTTKDKGEYIKDISSNSKHSTIWKYNYSGGSCLAIGINHPSRHFSYDWIPMLEEFLSMK